MTGFRKILVYFSKSGEALDLSQQELSRVLDTAFQATGLPVWMSEGKTPGVKMSFPTALPQGMESRLEAVEVQVGQRVTVREVLDRLGPVVPEGIRLQGGDALFSAEKWVVIAISYEVTPAPSAADVAELVAREKIPVERRGREVNLRPLILRAEVDDDRLRLEIAWTDRGTARPRDFLAALGRDPDKHVALKTGMTFQSSFGETIERTREDA